MKKHEKGMIPKTLHLAFHLRILHGQLTPHRPSTFFGARRPMPAEGQGH